MSDRLTRAGVEFAKRAASIPSRTTVNKVYDIPENEFWNLQIQRLREMYSEAKSSVPYYKNSQQYPKQLPDNGSLTELLSVLPVLRKQTVKERTSAFTKHSRNPLVFSHTTGGTTGTPLRVREDLLSRGWTEAILRSRNQRLSGEKSPRILRLSGYLDEGMDGGTLWQDVPGFGIAYLSIYQLTPARRTEILRKIRAFRPTIVHGYASALVELSRLFPSGELRPYPTRLVSTSETLDPRDRDQIERNLKTVVHNEYGSQEGQHLVLECFHRGMHIHPLRGVVEILSMTDDTPASAGSNGRVVVTGLQNRQMPLIRYDIGDVAESLGYLSTCKCGLRWPQIGTVHGREEDLVRTRDGRRIGLLSHSTLKDVEGIDEAQIVQNDYGHFTYRIRPKRTLNQSHAERLIRNNLRHRIGDSSAQVDFEYVESIPRSPAGKLRAVVVGFSEDD